MKTIILTFVAAAVVGGIAGCNRSATDSDNPVAISGNAMPAPAAATAASGIASAGDDQAQIAQAIRTHLADNKGINMGAMDMTVTPATINGDQAQATAEFRPKQGQGSMEVNYTLQRHAGGWIVTNSAPAGGQFQHPPMDKAHEQSGPPPSAGGSQFPDFNDYLKKKDSQSSARQ